MEFYKTETWLGRWALYQCRPILFDTEGSSLWRTAASDVCSSPFE